MTQRTKKKIEKRVAAIAARKPVITPLSHKDKLDILRDLMLQNPMFNTFGFNRTAIRAIKNEFNVDIPEDEMSRLKKKVVEIWQENSEIIYTKKKMLELLTYSLRKATREEIRLKCLEAICKVEGLYIDKIQHSGEISTGIKEIDYSVYTDEELKDLKFLQDKQIKGEAKIDFVTVVNNVNTSS